MKHEYDPNPLIMAEQLDRYQRGGRPTSDEIGQDEPISKTEQAVVLGLRIALQGVISWASDEGVYKGLSPMDLAARLRDTLTQIDQHCGQSSARMLIDTVEATGGLITNAGGDAVPNGDEDWLDLAYAYLAACDELEVLPLIDGERKAWAR